ncbi:hypothetical protein PJK55_14675 [Exiguobacterium sp. MMG028]|uniref:hypothetical protein n=1 Tax=Exiguobacterium sp. MMG028 TaxID=3021979 RepID=UPI0022FF398E|nr:hypothetical protein [Exiguobacterium sp. MMG028]MDA5561981.1 hypothetical protein [Exiguobacterium sp. MMG028]
MDKRMRRKILTLYSNGMNAHDITIQHNLDPRAEYTVTTMEVADVLREMGAADPTKRIPQKPDIQPDMPKRFISISESKKQRSKHKVKKKQELTDDQKNWHQLVCGFNRQGKKLLKSRSRHELLKKIQEFENRGWVQLGDISTDFYVDGETHIALMQRPEGGTP